MPTELWCAVWFILGVNVGVVIAALLFAAREQQRA